MILHSSNTFLTIVELDLHCRALDSVLFVLPLAFVLRRVRYVQLRE